MHLFLTWYLHIFWFSLVGFEFLFSGLCSQFSSWLSELTWFEVFISGADGLWLLVLIGVGYCCWLDIGVGLVWNSVA